MKPPERHAAHLRDMLEAARRAIELSRDKTRPGIPRVGTNIPETGAESASRDLGRAPVSGPRRRVGSVAHGAHAAPMPNFDAPTLNMRRDAQPATPTNGGMTVGLGAQSHNIFPSRTIGPAG
jgi:hypothetical protein